MVFWRPTLLVIWMVICLFASLSAQEDSSPMDQAKNRFNEGQYDEAIGILLPVYVNAKDTYKNHPDDLSNWEPYASALYLLGDCYWWKGNYPETESLFKEFIDLVQQQFGEKHKNFVDRIADLAALYFELGRYGESEKLFLQALELESEINGEIHLDLVGTWNNLAVLYDAMGKFRQSENLYLKVMDGYRELVGPMHPHYATALNNLGAFYNNMGRESDAVPLLEESLKIHLQVNGEKNRQYATSLNNLAMLYSSQGNGEKAKELLVEAIDIRKELVGDKHLEYLASLSNLAPIYLEENQPEKAIDITKKTADAYLELFGDRHPSYLNAIANQAAAFLRMGDYEMAESLMLQVVKTRGEILGRDHPDYSYALSNLAAVYIGNREFEKAEKYLFESLDLYANQIHTYFPGLSEKEQEKFYGIIKGKFEAFNSYALSNHHQRPHLTGRMFDIQLLTKALLMDAGRKVRKSILQSEDSLLVDQFKQWQSLREVAVRHIKYADPVSTGFKVELDSIQKAINDLEREISLNSGMFEQFRGPQPAWKEIQNVLKKGEAAIEVVRFRNYDLNSGGRFTDTVYYAAIVLTSELEQPQLIFMENGNLMEDRLIRAYLRDMLSGTNESGAYSHYWEPIQKVLKGIKRLYFSPDGVFHLINPGTFFQAEKGKYLADELDIVLLASTRELLDYKASPKISPNPSIVLMGFPDYLSGMESEMGIGKEEYHSSDETEQYFYSQNSSLALQALPGTKTEIEQINEILRSQGMTTEIYLEKEASKEKIKNLKRPKVLHIATHGFFDREIDNEHGLENPLLKSGLYLAGAGKPRRSFHGENWLELDELEDNGILTAYEAVGLDLEGTELVVLSACETALGEINNGEGVNGLQRAFKLAGAEALVMSLWKVDDRLTQELMTSFYRHWLKGEEKQQAFRSAQREIRKIYSDPFHWGAFVMVGQ